MCAALGECGEQPAEKWSLSTGEELHRFYFMALSINVVVFVAACHVEGDKLDEGFCQPSRPSQLIWSSPIRSSGSSLQLVSLNPPISLSQARSSCV